MRGAICVVSTPIAAAVDIARDFSPRVEVYGDRVVLLDLSGLTRLFGDADAMAHELHRAVLDRGVSARVAVAGTGTAARLLAVADGAAPDVRVVPCGAEADALAPLPITVLALMDADVPAVETFHRWGLRTLGDLAALPADALAARLGRNGVRWRRLARGEDLTPLQPMAPEERFEQAIDLEWPIEGLEPLSFVLGRLLDPLTAHLDRRGRSAAVLRLHLHLVTRSVHERTLQLPAPMRDSRAFRTLLLLDLESHPPPAAIDRVRVAVDPTPARVLQFSLLTRALPPPEQLSTLTARLSALMGEGRCGSPVLVDSWRPGAYAVVPFAPREPDGRGRPESPDARDQAVSAVRRFRVPVPASVRVEQGRPVRVMTGRRDLSGPVEICAGPWRTSGRWWDESPQRRMSADGTWDHDEWDATLRGGMTCRLYRVRGTNAWFVEGILD